MTFSPVTGIILPVDFRYLVANIHPCSGTKQLPGAKRPKGGAIQNGRRKEPVRGRDRHFREARGRRINFESGPEFTAELDRRLGITDGILRNLIVKRDPRHVAALNAQKAKKAEENNIDVEAIAVEAVEAPAAESAE